MSEEIKKDAVYTTAETQKILKISNSTMKRFLKKGLIRASRIGRQYRIMGKEILRLVSPKTEKRAIKSYLDLKTKVKRKTQDW